MVSSDEMRRDLRRMDIWQLRVRCGIARTTIEEAIGLPRESIHGRTVWNWENRVCLPSGPYLHRYWRIMKGLERHLEVSSEAWER